MGAAEIGGAAAWCKRFKALIPEEGALATVEFFFDCSSPWTYMGFHNMVRLADEFGVEVTWKPILVGGIFNTINPSVYGSRDHPVAAKQNYLAKDLGDWARASGLEIRWQPTVFPVNSVKAMRGCFAAEAAGQLVPFARAVFEAYWGADKNISQDPVLAEIAEAVGLDRVEFFRTIAQPEIKARLKANTDELIARGGFGTPTIFVEGDDMYLGNDRMALVREAILAARG